MWSGSIRRACLSPSARIDTVLSGHEYFTASSYEHSFDSRYFGVIRRDAIKGVARRIM